MLDYLWLTIKDGDPRASAIYRRHYTCADWNRRRRRNVNNPHRHLIMGPGEKMILLTPDCRALFGWRKFIDKSGQEGVNCSVFRNEGAFDGEILSSELIRAAERLAWKRWPRARLYTYVSADATEKRRGNYNLPGHCFRMAGWHECGRTQSLGLVILEKYPEESDA